MRYRLSRESAYWLIGLLTLALCGYRAATQSVVHDEAFTYLKFLSGGWRSIFRLFDANNHVLYSVLAKLSITCFGVSGFTLRLPTLAAEAGLLYFLARYCERRLGAEGPLLFAAIAWNPMLLDYAAAARGYTLGLMFLFAGLRYAPAHYCRTGIAFGLAVASNLTMAVSAVALALVFVRDPRRLVAAGAAGLATAAIILFKPLKSAKLDMFYYGASSLGEWAQSMVRPMLRHNPDFAGPLGAEPLLTLAQWLILPALLWLLWKRQPIGLALLACIAMLMVAHWSVGVLYPLDRTGLYLVPLFLLALWESLPARGAAVLAGLLTLQNISQLGVGHFVVWGYDAATRPAMAAVCAEARGPATLRAFWFHQPALEFYRRTLCPDRVAPIAREPELTLQGADFYAGSGRAAADLKPPAYRVIFADQSTGLTVAVPFD